jgi:hypothetical protein
VKSAFDDSLKTMRGIEHGQPFERASSLSSTLKRVDGIIDGWGKHYWFCNDRQAFDNLDQKIGKFIGHYLGEYRAIRADTAAASRQRILGVSELRHIPREPFAYPKLGEGRDRRVTSDPAIV